MNAIPIILFGTIIFCSLLAILGSTATKKLQDKNGCYYIGGPNGGGATRFFNQHPDAKQVFDAVENLVMWNKEYIDTLFPLGVKAVVVGPMGEAIVITNEMALAYGKPSPNSSDSGTKGQIFVASHKDEFFSHLSKEKIEVPIGSYTTTKQQKSVVGQAIVGSVIAGGVGAVVGAVDALNHNLQNKDAVDTHYVMDKSDLHMCIFQFHFAPNSFILKKQSLYISPELKNKVSATDAIDAIKDVCNLCW